MKKENQIIVPYLITIYIFLFLVCVKVPYELNLFLQSIAFFLSLFLLSAISMSLEGVNSFKEGFYHVVDSFRAHRSVWFLFLFYVSVVISEIIFGTNDKSPDQRQVVMMTSLLFSTFSEAYDIFRIRSVKGIKTKAFCFLVIAFIVSVGTLCFQFIKHNTVT